MFLNLKDQSIRRGLSLVMCSPRNQSVKKQYKKEIGHGQWRSELSVSLHSDPSFSFANCLKVIRCFSFIGVWNIQLPYNVGLVSGVQQSEPAMCIPISSLFWISFPLRSPQSTEWSSLCSTVGFHCCSVPKSCLTLCDPMDCSMPGFPVLQFLLEFAKTHVHWLGAAIQWVMLGDAQHQ